MALDSRPPWDISAHSRSEVGRIDYIVNGTPGVVQTSSLREKSYRPYYAKGSMVTLPGGTKFRRATLYESSTYRIDIPNKYFIVGEFSGYPRQALDDGYGLGSLVQNARSYYGGLNAPRVTTGMRSEAVTKALLDIGDTRAQIGENLATFRQTLTLFGSKGSLLLGALKSLRSKQEWWKFAHKSATDLGKNPASTVARAYLEYVYGLKPLVQDVHGVYELLKEQSAKSLILSGRGVSKQEDPVQPSGWTTSSFSRYRTVGGKREAKTTCRVFGRIDPANPGLHALQQVGLINPLSLGWELVPWSFVVDWFVPIGSVLQALSGPAGLIFIDGSLGIRSSEEVQYEYECTYGGTGALTSISQRIPMFPVLSHEGFRRDPLSGWPLPGFWFSKDPWAGDRGLKALALGILQLGRFRTIVR